MRTHVDTAAAVRRRDSDMFMRLTHDDEFCEWGPMSPVTTFFEEDDEELAIILRSHPEAEVVRVSRVVDIVV
jgi:hypothetical protein